MNRNSPLKAARFRLYSAPSKIGGHGIFTEDFIQKGSQIYTLTGDKGSLDYMNSLIDAGKITVDDGLQIDSDTYISLEPFGKSFNHCCEPNAAVVSESDLIAARDILPGEEVTYDYSATVGIEKTWWKMNCNCLAASCRKIASSVGTIPKHRLMYYYENNLLLDYIVVQLNLPKLKKNG